jgi:hypothetical protein
MTFTRDMLEASPVRIDLGLDDVAAAIDASLACEQACTSCANECLAEDDVVELRRCIALCENCADVCAVTARVLSRPYTFDHQVVHPVLQACVRTCTSSAEECERHAAHHRHCAVCLQACRACIVACTAVLEDEAFEELRKIAGG